MTCLKIFFLSITLLVFPQRSAGQFSENFQGGKDSNFIARPSSQAKKTNPVKKKKTSPSPSKTSSSSKNKKVATQSKRKSSPNSSPKTSAEAKRKQEEAQKEIKLTEAQIRENEAKVSKSLSQLGKLDQEINKTTAQIKELNTTLSKLNGEINSLENSISANEKDLTRLREEYLKAVKKMRVTKKNKTTLSFIFSAKSLSQASRRMRYLREFSTWRSRHAKEINSKISILKSQKDQLSLVREEQKKALQLQKQNEQQLSQQHQQQESLIAQLKENGKVLESHLQKKQAEAKELNNLVAQLIAQEQRKAEEEARRKAAEEARLRAEKEAKDKNTDKTQPVSEKSPTEYADARKRAPRGNKTETSSGSSFQSMRGKLPYPSTGSFLITSTFGRQHLPDLPDVEFDNPGIDAESEAGASARAVYKGKVSGVYLLPGYNTVVIVNHGDYYTVYGNISSPAVKNGDNVETGSNLGKLALNEGDSSHSCIHFEVWKNREKLNPQEWLR